MKTISLLAITLSSFFFISSVQAGHQHDSNRNYQQQDHRTTVHGGHRAQRKQHNAYRKGYRHAMRDIHQSEYIQHARPRIQIHSYQIYRPHHSLFPVIVGGLIGGIIANDISHGDPLITSTGVIAGTVLGHELGH